MLILCLPSQNDDSSHSDSENEEFMNELMNNDSMDESMESGFLDIEAMEDNDEDYSDEEFLDIPDAVCNTCYNATSCVCVLNKRGTPYNSSIAMPKKPDNYCILRAIAVGSTPNYKNKFKKRDGKYQIRVERQVKKMITKWNKYKKQRKMCCIFYNCIKFFFSKKSQTP